MFIKILKVLEKYLINKIDYTINAISGIDGLNPTIKILNLQKSSYCK